MTDHRWIDVTCSYCTAPPGFVCWTPTLAPAPYTHRDREHLSNDTTPTGDQPITDDALIEALRDRSSNDPDGPDLYQTAADRITPLTAENEALRAEWTASFRNAILGNIVSVRGGRVDDPTMTADEIATLADGFDDFAQQGQHPGRANMRAAAVALRQHATRITQLTEALEQINEEGDYVSRLIAAAAPGDQP